MDSLLLAPSGKTDLSLKLPKSGMTDLSSGILKRELKSLKSLMSSSGLNSVFTNIFLALCMGSIVISPYPSQLNTQLTSSGVLMGHSKWKIPSGSPSQLQEAYLNRQCPSLASSFFFFFFSFPLMFIILGVKVDQVLTVLPKTCCSHTSAGSSLPSPVESLGSSVLWELKRA